jgi:hypothetical protein
MRGLAGMINASLQAALDTADRAEATGTIE